MVSMIAVAMRSEKRAWKQAPLPEKDDLEFQDGKEVESYKLKAGVGNGLL